MEVFAHPRRLICLDVRQVNTCVTGQVFVPQTLSHLTRVYITIHWTGISTYSCGICSSVYCYCPEHLAVLQMTPAASRVECDTARGELIGVVN